jgi:hypothetical protein
MYVILQPPALVTFYFTGVCFPSTGSGLGLGLGAGSGRAEDPPIAGRFGCAGNVGFGCAGIDVEVGCAGSAGKVGFAGIVEIAEAYC